MIRIDTDWTQFKGFVDSHSLSIQEWSEDGWYILYARNEPWELTCKVLKPSSEATTYEGSYQASANQPLTQRVLSALGDDSGFTYDGRAVHITAPAGVNSTHDLLLTKKYAVKGGFFYADTNAVLGDSVVVQVVDVDNVLGLGAGVVLGQYLDWCVVPDQYMEAVASDVSMLPAAGLYMRTTYRSTGAAIVNAITNYVLYEVP